jgi:hypothetical protein
VRATEQDRTPFTVKTIHIRTSVSKNRDTTSTLIHRSPA